MRQRVWVVSLILIIFSSISAGCGGSAEELDATEEAAIISLAEQFIQQLADGSFEEATSRFDETMKAELPAADLQEAWEIVEDKVGPYRDHAFEQVLEQDGIRVVLINGSFEEGEATFSVSFDKDDRIAGFFIY